MIRRKRVDPKRIGQSARARRRLKNDKRASGEKRECILDVIDENHFVQDFNGSPIQVEVCCFRCMLLRRWIDGCPMKHQHRAPGWEDRRRRLQERSMEIVRRKHGVHGSNPGGQG